MPKYLIQASYTADGLKGLLRDGGTKRRAGVQQLVESVGGKLEALYFGFGSDVLLIIDAPDNVAVAAAMLTAGAVGAATNIRTSVLLTPEDIDRATETTVRYEPPGQ